MFLKTLDYNTFNPDKQILLIKLCYKDNIQADIGLQEEVECFSSFAWQQNEQQYIQGAIEL